MGDMRTFGLNGRKVEEMLMKSHDCHREGLGHSYEIM